MASKREMFEKIFAAEDARAEAKAKAAPPAAPAKRGPHRATASCWMKPAARRSC